MPAGVDGAKEWTIRTPKARGERNAKERKGHRGQGTDRRGGRSATRQQAAAHQGEGRPVLREAQAGREEAERRSRRPQRRNQEVAPQPCGSRASGQVSPATITGARDLRWPRPTQPVSPQRPGSFT